MARRKKRMTSKEFFRILEKIRANWRLVNAFKGYGHMRCYDKYGQSYDPLTRIYKELFGVWISMDTGWGTAAADLGLDTRFAERLLNADDNLAQHNRLRQKLLRATGLA